MSNNIKYSKGKVNSGVDLINQKIQQLLIEKSEEYDTIINLLSVSKGMEIDALILHLQVEKATVLNLAAFYLYLLDFIKNVSLDIEDIEGKYSQSHTEIGGMP